MNFEEDRKRQIETFLPAATEMARKAGVAKISLIQRQLGVGYTLAAALVDEDAAARFGNKNVRQ